MVWITQRDEAMFDWLRVVRITNTEGIRWMLGRLNGGDGPVTKRAAQMWCARMQEVGYIDRERVSGVGGSLVWGTHEATGQSAPNLFRQTTRHEVAVSVASAHFQAAGYSWSHDREAANRYDHQADGVAAREPIVQLVEVELTPKRGERYAVIFRALQHRYERGEIHRVMYLTTDEVAGYLGRLLEDGAAPTEAGVAGGRGAIRRPAALTEQLKRQMRQLLRIESVFDRRGIWETDVQPAWLSQASPAPAPAAPGGQLEGVRW